MLARGESNLFILYTIAFTWKENLRSINQKKICCEFDTVIPAIAYKQKQLKIANTRHSEYGGLYQKSN